jgi:hypothetical protein
MDSAGMTVYTIDEASGELKPIGHYPMGAQPSWFEYERAGSAYSAP